MEFNRLQRWMLTLVFGVLLGVAWNTNGFSLFIAFVPYFLLENYIYNNKQKYGASIMFLHTYAATLVWNTISMWWLMYASMVGVILGILLNSLLYATVLHFGHITKRRLGRPVGYLSMIVYWLGFEYIHHFWDLYHPWQNLGNWFFENIYIVQWYEYTGALGGSLWLLLINLLIFYNINSGGKNLSKKTKTINYTALGLLIGLPIIVSLIIFYTYHEKEDPIDIILLQPNIDPYAEKYNSELYGSQLDNLMLLSDSLADSTVDYIMGPETAFQHGSWEHQLETAPSVVAIRQFLVRYPNIKYIVGLSSYRLFGPGSEPPVTARPFRDEPDTYYDRHNTAIQLDTSKYIPIYHKSKLVLAVERMPFLRYIKFIENYALDMGGIVGSLGSDEERIVFKSPTDKLVAAPVICYESVFGEFVTGYIKNGANFIAIITNDGWWGFTKGHKQHFAFGRLRAIETRRSIARSANTGISAFINQRGEVFQATKYWERAVIRGKINANDKLTFYVKHGDIIGRVAAFLSVLIILFAIVKAIVPAKK